MSDGKFNLYRLITLIDHHTAIEYFFYSHFVPTLSTYSSEFVRLKNTAH
jgi:hypothetical protein